MGKRNFKQSIIMDSKFILENFKRQLQQEINLKSKVKKIILFVLFSLLFLTFIYIVIKQISFAKYFFL
jgi:hypothetical protein